VQIRLVYFADEFAADAGTDNVFVLGDFNSYTEEDPLQILAEAGYVNIGKTRTNEESYQFSGLVGSLDHAFASPEANQTVTGADIRNINSVEPVMYEYGATSTTSRTCTRPLRTARATMTRSSSRSTRRLLS
jgi:5'-nucleotidase